MLPPVDNLTISVSVRLLKWRIQLYQYTEPDASEQTVLTSGSLCCLRNVF